MKLDDALSLTPAAQEALRRRAVHAVLQGKTQVEVAAMLGVRRLEQATIFWGDETGMRSDHQAGLVAGRRGQTPVIPGTGQRFRCNLISATTNRGQLAFMVLEGKFTAAVFFRFLRRLLRHARRNVFLIVDEHPVHRAATVERQVARPLQRLRLFFLPGYISRAFEQYRRASTWRYRRQLDLTSTPLREKVGGRPKGGRMLAGRLPNSRRRPPTPRSRKRPRALPEDGNDVSVV